MKTVTPYEIVKPVVEQSDKLFMMNPGDFFDDDDLLVCGKCGKHKQTRINLAGYGNGNGTVVNCLCDCDKGKIDAEEKAIQEKFAVENKKRQQRESMMDKKFYEATFDKFEVDESNRKIYKLCHHYAVDFKDMLKNNQGLLLWGNRGTGKSFTAACIANELIKNEFSVVFTSLVKILSTIESSRGNDDEILHKLTSARLVIFDDFGAERSSDFALEKIYYVIDTRYRTELPMIITTNLTLDELGNEKDIRYARIYDRILEKCYPIQFTGKSRRIIEAQKRYAEMQNFLDGTS